MSEQVAEEPKKKRCCMGKGDAKKKCSERKGKCCKFERYCCCMTLDTAVTVIGLCHVNVALWWFWSFTTFQAVYLWFDLAICLTYAARAIAFLHGCYRDDMLSSHKSRLRYHRTNWIATIVLFVLVIAQLVLLHIDWGTDPVVYVLAWVATALFNIYNIFALKAFVAKAPDAETH